MELNATLLAEILYQKISLFVAYRYLLWAYVNVVDVISEFDEQIPRLIGGNLQCKWVRVYFPYSRQQE